MRRLSSSRWRYCPIVVTVSQGTFTVSLDMEATLDGECEGTSGSEVLNITIEMSGGQMVEVRAEG